MFPLSLMVLIASQTVPDVNRALIAEAAERNAATLGKIRAYSAESKNEKRDFLTNKNGELNITPTWFESSRYWRAGANYRIDGVNLRGRVFHSEWRDGVYHHIGTKPANYDPTTMSAIRSSYERRLIDPDPWEFSQFILPVGHMIWIQSPTTARYTLSQAIKSGKVTEVKWNETEPKQLRMVIEVQADKDQDCRYELTIDPNKNWLISGCVLHIFESNDRSYTKPKQRSQFHIEEWTESKPGIWCPTLVKSVTFMHDVKFQECITTISNIKLNEDVDAMPPMPSLRGWSVYDETESTSYMIDDDGNRVTPIPRQWPPVTTEPEAVQAEPRSNRDIWLAIGASAVVLLLGIAIVWRLRARGRAA